MPTGREPWHPVHHKSCELSVVQPILALVLHGETDLEPHFTCVARLPSLLDVSIRVDTDTQCTTTSKGDAHTSNTELKTETQTRTEKSFG